jgi:type I restriction enzyme S subunit
MAGEWTQTTVGDVAHRVTKGTTPTTVGGRFVESGIAFVKVEAITDDGRLQPEKFAFIDEETNRLLERSVLQEDDVLFTIAGTIGRVAKVDASILPANTNQAVAIIRPNREVVEPRFLYYALRSRERIRHAQTRVVQSVQANFSLSELSSIELLLPSKYEQRAIAHILGTLDDKIELNRRMSETLEAMARALFKSWFVDFEPVRVKAEGRDPGLPDEIAALFPDSFDENPELGEIPAAWESTTLSTFADLNPESWSKNTPPETVRYIDLANTKWGSITSIAEYSWEKAPSSARRVLRPWDTIVGTVRPGNGSYALVMEEGLTGSTAFAVLRPREPRYRSIVYIAATASDNIARLSHLADGTAYPAVRPNVVADTRVVRPQDAVLERFARMADPLLVRISAAEQETRTLAALRDALLPKLISGELRVKDAEKFIGRAV